MEEEISASSLTPDPQTKFPNYKKWWLYIILGLTILISLGNIFYLHRPEPINKEKPTTPVKNQEMRAEIKQSRLQSLPENFFVKKAFELNGYLYLGGSYNLNSANVPPDSEEALYVTDMYGVEGIADNFRRLDMPDDIGSALYITSYNQIFLLNYKVVKEGKTPTYVSENPDLYIGSSDPKEHEKIIWKKLPFDLPFQAQKSNQRYLVLQGKLCAWSNEQPFTLDLAVYCRDIKDGVTLGDWQKEVGWPETFYYTNLFADGLNIYSIETDYKLTSETYLSNYTLDLRNNIQLKKRTRVDPEIIRSPDKGHFFIENEIVYVVKNNEDGFTKVYAGHFNEEKIGLKEIYVLQSLGEKKDIVYVSSSSGELYAISSKLGPNNEIVERNITVFPLKAISLRQEELDKFEYASILNIVSFNDSQGNSKKFIMVDDGRTEGGFINADAYIADANMLRKTAIKIPSFKWSSVYDDLLVSVSPGPGKKFLLISYRIADSRAMFLVDERGSLISKDIVEKAFELIKDCQCGLAFERWKDNDEFYAVATNGYDQYYLIIDANTGNIGIVEEK